MVYKYNPKVNKKRPVIFLVCIAAPVAGACLYFFAGPLVGVVGAAAGLWVSFTIIKMLRRLENSKVETFTESCTAYTSGGEKLVFEYKDITHAGLVKGGPDDGHIFIYNENADKIVDLPPVFLDFEALKQELSANTPWQIYELEPDETIIDRLKKLVSSQTETAEAEEAEADDSASTADEADYAENATQNAAE
ncbi:MAG: hypothetical protein IKQ84_03780 [Spirochaetaceae bacterium]|nr:hypothetical protein [Spirochaetaceae bacterium]